MRSIPLRGFDQQMAGLIKNYMESKEHCGIDFIEGAVPVSIELTAAGKKLVHWKHTDGKTGSAEYDTVLMAVGRDVTSNKMGLDTTGVAINPKSGKIPTTGEQTNVPHIYAIGDVIDGEAL